MEAKFKDLKVGDKLIRMLGGTMPLNVAVSGIDNEFVYCTVPTDEQQDYKERVQRGAAVFNRTISEEELNELPTWTFSINNGAEIDPDLGWTETYTGSYLVKPEKI